MTDDLLQRRADTLAARVEALAEAVRAAGVPEEASVQLLSRASSAVLQALNLELLTARAPSVPKLEASPRASFCLVFDRGDEPFRTLKPAA